MVATQFVEIFGKKLVAINMGHSVLIHSLNPLAYHAVEVSKFLSLCVYGSLCFPVKSLVLAGIVAVTYSSKNC